MTAKIAAVPWRMVADVLGLGADQEARLVDEAHDRQVEGVAQVDVAAQLLRGLGGHRAGVEVRIVRDHADRLAAQAREPAHERAAELGRGLEEAPAVEHELERAAHLVRLAPLARHDREQLLLGAVGGIVAARDRRGLPDVGRQVGEEARAPARNTPRSSSAALSTTPLRRCTRAPPSSSLVARTPRARSTSAGPAISTCAVSRAISEKCDATSRAAGRPATAPSAADTTGACAIDLRERQEARRRVRRVDHDRRGAAGLRGATLPPPPSSRRTSGSRSRTASSSAITDLRSPAGDGEPPACVKSSPPTTHGPAVELRHAEQVVRGREADEASRRRPSPRGPRSGPAPGTSPRRRARRSARAR